MRLFSHGAAPHRAAGALGQAAASHDCIKGTRKRRAAAGASGAVKCSRCRRTGYQKLKFCWDRRGAESLWQCRPRDALLTHIHLRELSSRNGVYRPGG